MSSPAIFCVPYLHGASIPQLPPGVTVFPVGLPSSAAGGKLDKDPARSAVLAAFPLAPREAAAALEDLTRLGDELASGGILLQTAAGNAAGGGGVSGYRAGERAALDVFAATGDIPEGVPDWDAKACPDPRAIARARVECQKTLLLAWQLEGRNLEIRTLEQGLSLSNASLRAALGEGDGGDPAQGDAAAPEGDGEALPWRLVLEAMMPFVPGDCRLLAADAAMTFDLMEAGLLEPLPEDRAALCAGWPGEFVSGLLWAGLPVWKLTGKRGEDPARPWLSRRVEIFAVRPAGGWLRDGGRGAS